MPKGSNSPTIGDNGFLTKPGDNSKALNTIMGLYKLPKIDKNDDEAVERRIMEFFEYCAANDLKPGVESMSLAIGVDRRTLYDWETGAARGNNPRRSEIVKQAKRTLSAYLEYLAQNGKINPVTAIFLFKTQFGLIETTHIEIGSAQPLGDQLSPEEIAKRVGLPDPNDPVDVEWKE